MKRAVVAVLAGLALLLAGCTGVPGSSSPEVVRSVAIGGEDQSQKLVTPLPGVLPRNLVQSFLAVNADSAGKHASARSFLTTTAGSWTDTTVTVASSVSVAGYAHGSVTVNAAVVGTVAANGTYLPALQTGKAAVVQFPFGITTVKGQNRISSLRPGLLLTEEQFLDSYVPRSLYFFDLAHHYLVPDARWTPDGDPIQASEVLMNQLAAGPSLGLQDAVNNDALPAQSSTRHIDVSGSNPVRIEISGSSQLPATNKDRLAAQIAATLSDVDRGRSLEITDGGSPIVIPDAGGREFDSSDFGGAVVASPVPEVYYLRGGQIVDEKRRLVPGPLNYGRYPLQSLAVSRSGVGGDLSVAGTTTIAGRSDLVMGTQTDGLRRSTVAGVTTRPAFAPGRVEAWVGVGSQIYRNVLAGSRITSTGVQLQLPVPGQTVVALRLSPEGSRIALVLRDPVGHQSLYTGAVVRNASTNQVRINSLVQISPSNVTVTDLAWIEGERLNAIGYDSGSPDDAHVYRTGADGSAWTEYGIGELPGPPATLAGAPGQPAWAAAGTPPSNVYLQRSGVTWSNPGSQSSTALGYAPTYVE